MTDAATPAMGEAVMARLAARLAPRRIDSTEGLGIPPDRIEAAAFAWLAHRTMAGEHGNVPEVTGARIPVVLGGIYPGRAGRGERGGARCRLPAVAGLVAGQPRGARVRRWSGARDAGCSKESGLRRSRRG